MDGLETGGNPSLHKADWGKLKAPLGTLKSPVAGTSQRPLSKRRLSLASTPKKLIGVELTTADAMFKLPYKVLDPKTGLYEVLPDALQKAVHWQAGQLGIEMKHLNALSEAVGIQFGEKHQVQRVGNLEATLSPKEVQGLSEAHKRYVNHLKSKLFERSEGAMSRQAKSLEAGKLDTEEWVVNTLATQAALANTSSAAKSEISSLPRADSHSKVLDAPSHTAPLREASLASLSTQPSTDFVDGLSENELLAALVPDQRSTQSEASKGLLGRFMDFSAKVKKDFADWAYQKHLAPQVGEKMKEGRIAYHFDLKNYPFSAYTALMNRGSSTDDLVKQTGLQEEYLEYVKKSKGFRDLVHESSSAVVNNYQSIFSALKAAFSPPTQEAKVITFQPVPMGLLGQVKNFFELKREGQAVLNKFRRCIDEGERVSKQRLMDCVHSDAEWFADNLLNFSLLPPSITPQKP